MAKADKNSSGKNLVIVESPSKAKTINKYLGKDFVVKASVGHVRDLPARNPKGVKAPVPGVDIEHDFAPSYVSTPRGKKTITELKKLAKVAPMVYLATDLDREGEAIAWHLAEALKLKEETTRRVVFNEITKSAIQESFANPRNVDMDMVNAQQARRILDRIVGYQVSPLLWKKVAGGLSAGRVQSVAVRLIVEREREIEAFMPEEYWRIGGVFTSDLQGSADVMSGWKKLLATKNEKGDGPTKKVQQAWLAEHDSFNAELVKVNDEKFQPKNCDDALVALSQLGMKVADTITTHNEEAKGPAKNKIELVVDFDNTPEFTVTSLNSKSTQSRPPAPFITSSLQQTASTNLYFAARRTMRIAQQLYEGIKVPGEGEVGLITYMRTDSRNLSMDAINSVRDMIGKDFGAEYLPEKPNFYSSGSRAQEAHEAIRPTDATRTPEKLRNCLTEEQYKLYKLIWSRFVACQMTPAKWLVTEAIISAQSSAKIDFRATGRSLAFDGFLRATGLPTTGDQILPELAQGKAVAPVDILPKQHFTQGPGRYTEASLIKALEADNIGRPSTYASIIQTIQDRNYVNQENRAFRPTDLGVVVTDKLVTHFPELFQVTFTAHMENQLDNVEAAQANWVAVLHEFYGPFVSQLTKAQEEMVHAKAETQPSDYKCPECGEPMVYRFGKNGRFLSCGAYPDCKAAQPIDDKGRPVSAATSDIACPICSKPLIMRKGRFGPFLSCPDYPKCKGIVNLDKKGCVKPPSAPPLEIDEKCPKCDAPTVNMRRSKRGPWLSCTKYPKCRGRVAWTKLDPEKQEKFEKELEIHEKAHPQPKIHKTDGSEVPADYKPVVTTETLDD